MNRETGASLDLPAHISQSIDDILGTRIGTRIMRREYGSLLPELIDEPFNDVTRLRIYAAIAMAVIRWKPRIGLTRVQFFGGTLAGDSVFDLEGILIDDNVPQNLRIPLQLGAGV
ncbi:MULTISPECIES: GPW/gp25 family protein [unclassified Pseudomonas]|uniref:GPW/gp25 family protein n=1 Tax=unclassified Pseudomonas TaxID=196821 RepID=UPI002B235687|nr:MULTISPECIES: GPW/gp25 family protein [unclassified Pseudomonas]MEA9976669.1 GPW/gp25 family protein [Pseudomonas sp. RTS4]MEB0195766.1 GPW/gp25 family protein [Pseudomonas sp. 5S4]MEB0244735.1 GPW/gp25 family protein [Pseudomonas sp. 10S5]